MHKTLTNWAVIAAILLSFELMGSASAADPNSGANSFYKGKTLTMIIPYSPGGGYDAWVRLSAPYIKQYLGAANVKIVNKPGGGGLIGTNAIYNAKPDGLTIGDTNSAGDVFAQMADIQGVDFDVTKFNWIGRPDDDPHIIAVHANSPYKDFDDLVALKGTDKVVKALATGHGSSDYNSALITYNAFDMPFRMVAAFSGSHAEKAAFVAGNGTTISVSASDIAQLGNKARVVVVTADEPFAKLPGVPSVVQAAKKHNLPQDDLEAVTIMGGVMAMGHAFFAPPGVPEDRVQALRSAFKKTFHNQEFRKKVKNSGLYIGYMPGKKLDDIAQQALSHEKLLDPYLEAKQ